MAKMADEELAEAIRDVQMDALAEEREEQFAAMANMSDEEWSDQLQSVQMGAVAEVIEDLEEDLEVQANITQVLQMTPEQLAHVDMTSEELEYFVAHCCHVELEKIDGSQELSVEEIFLSKADLIDLLQYNMEEVGDNIKEFEAFMNFLIENGLYQDVAEVPVAEVPVAEVPVADVPMDEVPVVDVLMAEVPAAEIVSEADKRKKASILMARLNSVIKTGKKRNSNVVLDEEEIEHHRKMLKTVEQAGQVFS